MINMVYRRAGIIAPTLSPIGNAAHQYTVCDVYHMR